MKTIHLILFLGITICMTCRNKEVKLNMPDAVFTPIGPDAKDWEAALSSIEKNSAFRAQFKGKRYRILKLIPHLVSAAREGNTNTIVASGWEAEVYNYTDDKAYVIQSGGEQGLQINELAITPQPNAEELAIAQQALRQFLSPENPQDTALLLTDAMPPVIQTPEGNRALTFWTSQQRNGRQRNGLYAVNVSLETPAIVDIQDSLPHLDFTQVTCGPPSQDVEPSFGGQWLVQIPDPIIASANLWEFTVVAPSSSSGASGSGPVNGGSGVELLNVYYRGKLVMKRAHTPKLNVKYEEGCQAPVQPYCTDGTIGGYDDGKGRESDFNATGTLLVNGFMNCSTMPTTIVDTGNDTGNFKGVAFYKDNSTNTFLVTSELQFGWYRYVSEWTFHVDGKIEPRFKFNAVNNGCTCHRHVHHVYWRFDFDVNGTNNRVIESFNSSPPKGPGSGNWQSYPPFATEVTRNQTHPQMMWSIDDFAGSRVDLIPGPHDSYSTSSIWTKGDVFVAKYYPGELNEWAFDAWTACFNEASLINGESLSSQDIVLWYRAGSLHDEDVVSSHEHPIVGPIIQCSWVPDIIVPSNDDDAF